MINTKLNKALRKNENTVVMLLLLHRPPCDVTVFCAFEIWLPMSAQKRHWQQQLVPRWWRRNSKTDCSYTNRLLYTEIDPTTWIERLHSACRHSHSVWRFHGRTLIQRQSWSQTISVVCAGNRNNTASLLMEWYYLASKQRLVWIGTLYIYDPISLLAFSVSSMARKGRFTAPVSLCCSWHFEVCLLWSSSPVDEARRKTDCKHNDSVQCPLLKFLHKEVGYHMGRQRMRCHSSHLFIQTQTRRCPSKCHHIRVLYVMTMCC